MMLIAMSTPGKHPLTSTRYAYQVPVMNAIDPDVSLTGICTTQMHINISH